MHSALKSLAAAVLLGCTTAVTAADSGPFSQLIVFGDSLSDAGNFPDLQSPTLGGNPTGGLRFTNRSGPTYGAGEYIGEVGTQRLANMLGLQSLPSTPLLPTILTGNPDGTNYAVGGYRTDQILDSINSESTVSAGSTTRSRPGYLVENARVDSNALYYLNGGGNDIFQLTSNPVTMSQAAGNLVTGNWCRCTASGRRTLRHRFRPTRCRHHAAGCHYRPSWPVQPVERPVQCGAGQPVASAGRQLRTGE